MFSRSRKTAIVASESCALAFIRGAVYYSHCRCPAGNAKKEDTIFPLAASLIDLQRGAGVTSRNVARTVAAEVTRRNCSRARIRLVTSAATILGHTLLA